MDNYEKAKAIIETPDFERAYEIDSRVYNGQEVTDEEKKFVKEYMEKLCKEHSPLPMSISLWIAYAGKDYV